MDCCSLSTSRAYPFYITLACFFIVYFHLLFLLLNISFDLVLSSHRPKTMWLSVCV